MKIINNFYFKILVLSSIIVAGYYVKFENENNKKSSYTIGGTYTGTDSSSSISVLRVGLF